MLLAVASVTAVQAQVTTAVRGTVVNQQQQPVAGASVRITHTPSGTVSLATSSESGVFLLAGCGSADLTQSRFRGGFPAVQVDDLYLALDRTLDLPVTVQVDNAIEETVVTATRKSVGYATRV